MMPRSKQILKSRTRSRRESTARSTNGCATHVYQHGRKFKPNELVERATGGEMNIGPYLSYLRNKYGELYRLQNI